MERCAKWFRDRRARAGLLSEGQLEEGAADSA
jgi:hypothetical protein